MTVPSSSVQVETGHQDMIVSPSMLHVLSSTFALTVRPRPCSAQHDAQLDYYGRRLATASSDRTLRIFDVEQDDSYKLVDSLQGSVQTLYPHSDSHD